MSGIGFWELIILFLIGLIVLGPERLPRVANQLGGWLGQARRMTRVMRRQLEDELNFEKESGIKKPTTSRPTVSNPQYVQDDPVEHDDDFSPQHDTGSVGSGVGDDRDNVDDKPESPGDSVPAEASDDDVKSTDTKQKSSA